MYYKRALEPGQWPRAERFIKMIQSAREYAEETKIKPAINWQELIKQFAKVEG